MRAVRAITGVAAIVAASALATVPGVAADARAAETSAAQTFAAQAFAVPSGVTVKTVSVSDVTSGTPFVAFTVPECVAEIAYVMDGGAGGATRRVGTNQYAVGGAGAVRSGKITVTPGEQLRLYPAAQGVSAQPVSDIGSAGSGGLIGYRKGGGGTGIDEGAGLWTVRQNAGAGGGAAAAIAVGSTPIVVAAGGGGAGGSSWDDTKNTAVGGAGDARGGDGVRNAGSGGALGAGATGEGLRGGEASGNGGGSGGGGGGYLGGGAGRASSTGSQGGGGGAGGTSFIDTERQSLGSIADYGLAASDVTPTGDGIVKIAWGSCGSVLSLQGTITDSSGDVSPAASWGYSVAVANGSAEVDGPNLDANGLSNVLVRGYASASDTRTVTVTLEARAGWVLRDWDDTTVHRPFATCENLTGDGAVTVTNVGAHSFRFDTSPGDWIDCSFDSVESAPDMSVTASAIDVETGLPAGPTVTAGDDVTFSYAVSNTGNVPLDLTISDPRNPDLTCEQSDLPPGDQTTCSGTTSVTRD